MVNGYYRIPIPMLTINSVAPIIEKVGTPEQKKRFLPPILKGELTFGGGANEVLRDLVAMGLGPVSMN